MSYVPDWSMLGRAIVSMYTVFLMFNSHTLRSRLDRVIDTNHGTVRGLVRAMLAQTEFVLGRLEDTRTLPGNT